MPFRLVRCGGHRWGAPGPSEINRRVTGVYQGHNSQLQKSSAALVAACTSAAWPRFDTSWAWDEQPTTSRCSGGRHVRMKVATCKVCGWHGIIIRHKPGQCARYLQIRKMYLAGMTSREIGRKLGTSFESVLHALKAGRVKTRPPGGLNNPSGINGRFPRAPLWLTEGQTS